MRAKSKLERINILADMQADLFPITSHAVAREYVELDKMIEAIHKEDNGDDELVDEMDDQAWFDSQLNSPVDIDRRNYLPLYGLVVRSIGKVKPDKLAEYADRLLDRCNFLS